ncbi:hypothetical protein ACWGRF_02160 [Streptomyces zhihengii]
MTEVVTVPGAGFIAGVLHVPWVDLTDSGPMPWLLLACSGVHLSAEDRAEIEPRLRAMCDEIGLRPASERVAFVGPRLALRARFLTLDYGHPRWVYRVPEPGPAWREAAQGRGAAMLAIGLEPLAVGSGQEAVRAYLNRFMPAGRVLLGAVGVRGR